MGVIEGDMVFDAQVHPNTTAYFLLFQGQPSDYQSSQACSIEAVVVIDEGQVNFRLGSEV